MKELKLEITAQFEDDVPSCAVVAKALQYLANASWFMSGEFESPYRCSVVVPKDVRADGDHEVHFRLSYAPAQQDEPQREPDGLTVSIVERVVAEARRMRDAAAAGSLAPSVPRGLMDWSRPIRPYPYNFIVNRPARLYPWVVLDDYDDVASTDGALVAAPDQAETHAAAPPERSAGAPSVLTTGD